MSKTLTIVGIIVASIIGASLIAGYFLSVNIAESSSFQGTRTLVSSSTVKVIVGPGNATTVFGVLSGCTNRVVSTLGEPIMLTFATSTDLDQTVEPTASFGHSQGASTTVSYDSGLYGCGVMQAYGFNSSTTLSVSEFRGFK